MVYLFKMVIFYSYAKLPEGISNHPEADEYGSFRDNPISVKFLWKNIRSTPGWLYIYIYTLNIRDYYNYL